MHMRTEPSQSPADEAWRKVRALKPLILDLREEGDRLRRLPDPIAEAFLAADLYRVQVPLDLGGAGLDPLLLLDLVEEISSYDGSVGWNYAIGASGIVLCGGMTIPQLRELFGNPHCCLAGSGALGRAVAVEGGYRLSGRWGWASGIHQARLVGGNAVVFDGDKPRLNEQGAPVTRFCFVPKDGITILDTWRTGGMRGTGSTDWEASDLFVPEENAIRVYAGESAHPAPVFRLPGTYFGLVLCIVAVGIARAAYQELTALATQPGSALRDNAFAQYAVAKAQALHESSHLNVRESFRTMWDNVCEGRPHTLDQRARVRRSYVHAVESSIEAVRLCNEAAGGAAVFETSTLGRALRDVHAVSAHIVLSRRFMEMAGQVAFGLPVGNPIF